MPVSWPALSKLVMNKRKLWSNRRTRWRRWRMSEHKRKQPVKKRKISCWPWRLLLSNWVVNKSCRPSVRPIAQMQRVNWRRKLRKLNHVWLTCRWRKRRAKRRWLVKKQLRTNCDCRLLNWPRHTRANKKQRLVRKLNKFVRTWLTRCKRWRRRRINSHIWLKNTSAMMLSLHVCSNVARC